MTSVTDNIQWVPIVAVSLALMLAAAVTLWVAKQDELRTAWVRVVTVTVLIALLLSTAGAVWVEYQVPGMWPPWFGPPEQDRQVGGGPAARPPRRVTGIDAVPVKADLHGIVGEIRHCPYFGGKCCGSIAQCRVSVSGASGSVERRDAALPKSPSSDNHPRSGRNAQMVPRGRRQMKALLVAVILVAATVGVEWCRH